MIIQYAEGVLNFDSKEVKLQCKCTFFLSNSMCISFDKSIHENYQLFYVLVFQNTLLVRY